MKVSARNQFKGTVTQLRVDGVMAEVTIILAGGQELVSVITRSSAESLGIKIGVEVTALIKSTEVMVAR